MTLRTGFRKVDPDKWEFANNGFFRGQKHLLKSIQRRKAPSQVSPPQHQALAPYLELGKFGVDGGLNHLKRDKQVLKMELVKLRQQQQITRTQLQAMEVKLQGTERKQQQMMAFLAKAIQNPNFIKQLVQQKGKTKELEEAINKKRRRPIDQGESSRSGQGFNPVKAEPFNFEDFRGYEVSELEVLALEMQGFGKAREEQDEDIELFNDEAIELFNDEDIEQFNDEDFEQFNDEERDIDDGIWEELLTEKINEESGIIRDEDGEEEDVNVLAIRLGHLGSSNTK